MIEDYSDPKDYYFDDLGVENTVTHYGKDCNVLGEILISRYDLFKEKGINLTVPPTAMPKKSRSAMVNVSTPGCGSFLISSGLKQIVLISESEPNLINGF